MEDPSDKQRKAVRNRREQLLTLVNNWDPAGVLASGAPRTEYEPLVDQIFDHLSRGASRDDVATFLTAELRNRYGNRPQDLDGFVNRAFTWYQLE